MRRAASAQATAIMPPSETHLEGVGGADRVRQLRGQRRGHRLEVVRLAAVVDRHLPPLAVPRGRAEALRAV